MPAELSGQPSPRGHRKPDMTEHTTEWTAHSVAPPECTKVALPTLPPHTRVFLLEQTPTRSLRRRADPGRAEGWGCAGPSLAPRPAWHRRGAGPPPQRH